MKLRQMRKMRKMRSLNRMRKNMPTRLKNMRKNSPTKLMKISATLLILFTRCLLVYGDVIF